MSYFVRSYLSLFLLFMLLAATGCKKNNISKQLPNNLASQLSVENNRFSYFTGKAKIQLDGLGQNVKATANIRIKQDSLIWVSVSPGLGIEIARVMITPHQVLAIDKFNRKAYIYDFNVLTKKLKFPVNFALFQSVLVGNLPFPLESYNKVKTEELFFVLLKNQNNITLQNYINRSTLHLEKTTVVQQGTAGQLQVAYSDFEKIDNNYFPLKGKVHAESLDEKKETQTADMELNYIRIKTPSDSPGFPFNIPEGYQQIKNKL